MNRRTNESKKRLWRGYCTAAVLLTCLSFTPLILPAGRHTPLLAGLPFTLWTGIGLSIALVLITYLATRVHPGTWSEEPEKK